MKIRGADVGIEGKTLHAREELLLSEGMSSALSLKMNQKDECFTAMCHLRWLDVSWFL